MWSTLKRYWAGHILVLLAVVVLVNFGLWQLRRLDERRALNQEILAGLNQPATTLSSDPITANEVHRHRVVVSGQFDNDAAVVLRNRSWDGRPGVDLVVPLHINASDYSVLVNRGWIPLAESTPEARRAFDMAGDVTIEGIAYRSQTRPDTYFAATDPTPSPPETRLDAWFRVDIARIAQQLDEPLLPIFIVQSPDEPMANALPLRQETTDLGEGPHLGYAMQWFSFAIVLVVLYAVFLWQQAGNRQPNTNTQELEKPI